VAPRSGSDEEDVVDAMTMMRLAVGLLAIAAVGGLAMAARRFAGKVNPPAWLSMLHGFLAAAALTLLATAAWFEGIPALAQIALLLFVLAAAGGVVLNLGYQWKQRLLPATLVIGHALLAVFGFALLSLAAFAN
jgi:hypothetical protein